MFLSRTSFWKRNLTKFHYSSLATTTLTKTTNEYTNPSIDGQQPNLTKWNIYTSLVLVRRPVLTRQYNDIESRYNAFLQEYEYENSHKSNHELRGIQDENLLVKIRAGEIEQGNIQTAVDFEDLSNTEYTQFVPAPRITAADISKDTKSTHRSLDSYLILLIQQKLGQDYKWICPQVRVNETETLRQATDRLSQSITPSIQSKIYGLAPHGYYKYKYPKTMTDQTGSPAVGAKVWFYKASYISGGMTDNSSNEIQYNDFTWASRSEMKVLLNAKYYKSLNAFLVPE